MLGSEILEVAIGLVFVYILVSIICSTIREGIAAILKTRAVFLERAIRELLRDPSGRNLAKEFFEHPLIAPLYSANGYKRPPFWKGGNGLPSYIPSASFATALLDLAARGPVPGPISGKGEEKLFTLDAIRQRVNELENPAVQRVLLTAVDTAEGDLEKARAAIEAWYDSAMDRISGWYRRRTQWVIAIIAIVAAVGLNVDTISVVRSLYVNDSARAAVVAIAEKTPSDISYEQAKAHLDTLPLPIGWKNGTIDLKQPAQVWLGWILTALAATLGAPFWFDVLNKIMVIRSTVKPREKSPEDKSKER